MGNEAPSYMAKSLQAIKQRFQSLKAEKSGWEGYYDILARYILGRRNYINSNYCTDPLDLMDPEVYDNTAGNACHLMAAAHVGALWPNGAASFALTMPFALQQILPETDELAQFFQFASQQMADIMDDPRCGFLTTLEEYMVEQGAFGLGAIFVEEEDDFELPVSFRCVNAKDLFVDVDRRGVVDTVYIRRWMTLRDIYKQYGPDSFTESELKEVMEEAPHHKSYEIVIAIEPRDEYGMSEGNQDFPYASCHVDITRNRLLRESGFKELPVFVGRFYHILGEKYGRSPGMVALKDIRELNQIRYDTIIAGEKMLNPPTAVVENCIVGNGNDVDLSAGEVTVISASAKLGNYNGKPIEPILDVGDPQWAFQRITELTEAVKNHFLQDRLMDLNNEQRMTLGEANIRNELRGQSLNSSYTRQIKEVLEPIIQRVFNIMLGKGLLGVVKRSQEEADLLSAGVQPRYIPDVLVDRMVKGQEVYKIRFISPAARIRHAEEVTGILETLQAAINLAQIDPTVLDGIDTDVALRRVGELKGAPAGMLRSDEAIAKIRQQRQQQQEEQMKMMAQQQAAATAKDMAKAQADMEKAA